MKRSIKNRILSWLLTICMLFSIAPQTMLTQPAQALEPEDLVWDFRKGHTGDAAATAWDYVRNLTYEDTGSGGSTEKNPELPSEPWQQRFKSGSTTIERNPHYLANFQDLGVRLWKVDYNPSFTLKLDQAGTYMPQVTLAAHPTLCGQIVRFSFSKLEGDTETKLSEVHKKESTRRRSTGRSR